MERKSLLNQLELGYAPLTAYEFAIIKDDKLVHEALQFSNLYILAQRPVITFENISMNPLKYSLTFEIHQKGNPNILIGNLPLIQKVAGSKDTDTIAVAFNFFEKSIEFEKFPINNVHGFSLVKELGYKQEFLIWFSPEKLLQNWWKGNIDCDITGDFKSFTIYNVHYVGKATKQSIFKRLTGHSTFQDILSLETPVTEKQLPANEIVILPFMFQNNLEIHIFGDNADVKTMTSALTGESYPQQEKVFLDAEKALIKAMKPKYNKALFKNYPVSKDGLFENNYNYLAYTFIDPITLKYNEEEICGGLSDMGGDSIVITDNQHFKLIKSEK